VPLEGDPWAVQLQPEPAAQPDTEPQPGADHAQPPAHPEPPAYPPPVYPEPPAYPPPAYTSADAEDAMPPTPLPPPTGPFAVAGASVSFGGQQPNTDEAKPNHFRPDIEGLRAVAIIAVLLFHIGLPFAAGGFVGVDVFYVISGFLITGLLLREGQESGKVNLVRFYARRARRLLPAALLVIVVTLVMSAVIVSPLRLSEIAGDAAAAALYVANFRFALESTNYLAVEAPSPLLHYWSLAVEEQFYLVWPLVLLLITRFLALRWVGLAVLLLAVGSFGLSLYWTEANQAWAFFSPVTRAWQLAAGALIAIGLLRIPARIPAWVGGIAVVAGLVLIVVSVVLISDAVPFPGLVALMPVLGAVLVIVGGLRGPTLPGRIVLANPLSRYVGHISYSLYLWHWPLLILIPIAIDNDELGVRLALAGVAVLLAALSTELVERPFRSSSFLSQRPRFSVELGLSGSVAVGVAALFMSGALALPSNIPMPWLQPDPIVVELAGVRQDRPALYADGCDLLYKQKKLRTDCVYGDPEGEKTAVLMGDSHAAQWLPALDRYAQDIGWRLNVHTKPACAVTDVPVWERRLRREFKECIAWREALMKEIRKTKPEAVFVGLSRDYEMWDNGRIVQSREAQTYWRDKLAELLTTLDKRADRVVLLAETPFLNYDPVDCLANEDIVNCDPAKSLALDRSYAQLESAAAEAAGVELLSINDLLCPHSSCPVVVDDIVVFRDAHHLTASFMEYLSTPIGRLLEGKSPYPSPSPTLAPGRAEAAA